MRGGQRGGQIEIALKKLLKQLKTNIIQQFFFFNYATTTPIYKAIKR